jgi:mRNA interferase YafQ
MKTPVYSGQFKRDYKLAQKRGKNISELLRIIGELLNGNTLPPKNRDHPLSGDYAGCRECHVEPDWLLIYQDSETEITLVRLGSHSDLF